MTTIQLEGVQMFGTSGDLADLDDFSADASKVVVHLARNKVARKPTYANARTFGVPGASQDTLEIVYEPDFDVASGLYVLLLSAHIAGTLVYWSGQYATDTVSASNHRYEGSFYVDAIDVGAEAGGDKERSNTYDLATFAGPLTTPLA